MAIKIHNTNNNKTVRQLKTSCMMEDEEEEEAEHVARYFMTI